MCWRQRTRMRREPGSLPTSEGDPSGRWWQSRTATVAGVFEGGGAKGVAYTGALQALWKRRLWFSSVAGASAGAISATLVAAGIHPDRIGELTGSALRQISWSDDPWRQAIRMVWTLFTRTGALRKDRFGEWLEGLLRDQVAELTGGPGDRTRPVTFASLFCATGIELHVVAVDISVGRQIVFNHLETPDCEVSQAVAASSSIPIAFPSSELYCESEEGARFHTIVDGGVWTNFPMFLYRDVAYRRSRRLPDEPRADHVIGFLLDEGSGAADLAAQVRKGQTPRPYVTSAFTPPENYRFHALEWCNEPRSGWRQVLRLMNPFFWPLAIERYVLTVGSFGRVLGGGFGGEGRRLWARWPTPTARVPRMALQFVDGSLGLLSYLVLGLLAWVILALVAFQSAKEVWSVLPDRGWFGVVLTLVLVALGCLIVLMLFGTLWNVLTYPTLRRIGYGLGRTYVAGAGAHPWAAVADDVVPLPIPEDVTTLSFGLDAGRIRQLTADARRATEAFLDTLLEPSEPSDRSQAEKESGGPVA